MIDPQVIQAMMIFQCPMLFAGQIWLAVVLCPLNCEVYVALSRDQALALHQDIIPVDPEENVSPCGPFGLRENPMMSAVERADLLEKDVARGVGMAGAYPGSLDFIVALIWPLCDLHTPPIPAKSGHTPPIPAKDFIVDILGGSPQLVLFPFQIAFHSMAYTWGWS